MQPAAFAINSATQEVWSTRDYYFSLASAPTQGCGTITYKVVEAATLTEVDPTVFTVSTQGSVPFVTATFSEKQPWVNLSPFSIVIEAQLGAYTKVYSDPLQLTIVDPCVNTVINSQFIMQMTASAQATDPVQRTLSVFKDSVSMEFGDEFGDGSGHDLCGPQTY